MSLPGTNYTSIGWFWLCVFLSVTVARAGQAVYGSHAMVVAQEPLAADVGLEILKAQSGNAVDAAVAVGFALAVTHPSAGNIGGGGFMLVRMANGKASFFDFRETAPGLAKTDMYLQPNLPADASQRGWLSVAVPGTVSGLALAHAKYGTMKWAKLLQPALRLASQGFPISHWQARDFRANAKFLSQPDAPDSRHIFLKDGAFYRWGERFRQPELANTLERISRHGPKDFYEGKTAQLIVEAMAQHHGLIKLQDLRGYQARELEPVMVHYQNYEILSAPLPSCGGICLLQMLTMLEGSGYQNNPPGSAQAYHYLADVMRLSYSDRNRYLGDPDFASIPFAMLTNRARLLSRRSAIDPDKATSSDAIGRNVPINEGNNTTHFSIVDSSGNAVAVTYTLNLSYGSGVTVPGAGFLLNNEMDDFTTKPNVPNAFGVVQSTNNFIEPHKRPLSSMTPTIVLTNGKPFMVLGAPGGTRIPSAVLQVLLNVVDFHMPIQKAVDFPRIHAQGTDTLVDLSELQRISPDTVNLLTHSMNYAPDPKGPPVIALIEAILIHDGVLEGAHDDRGPGKAVGW